MVKDLVVRPGQGLDGYCMAAVDRRKKYHCTERKGALEIVESVVHALIELL
jgi:hypothetical protein